MRNFFTSKIYFINTSRGYCKCTEIVYRHKVLIYLWTMNYCLCNFSIHNIFTKYNGSVYCFQRSVHIYLCKMNNWSAFHPNIAGKGSCSNRKLFKQIFYWFLWCINLFNLTAIMKTHEIVLQSNCFVFLMLWRVEGAIRIPSSELLNTHMHMHMQKSPNTHLCTAAGHRLWN